MRIDLPIFLAYDVAAANPGGREIANAAGRITFTLRFDPDDEHDPAMICPQYPPRDDAPWFRAGGDLFDLVPRGAWEAIRDRARQSPEDYGAVEMVEA